MQHAFDCRLLLCNFHSMDDFNNVYVYIVHTACIYKKLPFSCVQWFSQTSSIIEQYYFVLIHNDNNNNNNQNILIALKIGLNEPSRIITHFLKNIANIRDLRVALHFDAKRESFGKI